MMRETSQMALGCLLAVLFALMLVVGGAGCSTVEKKWDPCQTMTVAQGTHATALGVSLAICALMPKEKRAKCLEERAKYEAAGKAVLDIATSIIKACKL